MRPVHFEVEILYDTTYRGACGVYSAGHAYTKADAQVTCPKCLEALGYETSRRPALRRLRSFYVIDIRGARWVAPERKRRRAAG